MTVWEIPCGELKLPCVGEMSERMKMEQSEPKGPDCTATAQPRADENSHVSLAWFYVFGVMKTLECSDAA